MGFDVFLEAHHERDFVVLGFQEVEFREKGPLVNQEIPVFLIDFSRFAEHKVQVYFVAKSQKLALLVDVLRKAIYVLFDLKVPALLDAHCVRTLDGIDLDHIGLLYDFVLSFLLSTAHFFFQELLEKRFLRFGHLQGHFVVDINFFPGVFRDISLNNIQNGVVISIAIR